MVLLLTNLNGQNKACKHSNSLVIHYLKYLKQEILTTENIPVFLTCLVKRKTFLCWILMTSSKSQNKCCFVLDKKPKEKQNAAS